MKTPEQEAVKVARGIGLPPEQVGHGVRLADVANWSERDQRHSIRSRETRTVRKLTRVDKLFRAGVIERHEAQACEWYAEAHALGYDTIGCTANYQGAGGGGFGSDHLMARYRAQGEARDNYNFAREGIPAMFLPMFEAIVIGGASLNDAAGTLYGQLSRSQRAHKLSHAFRFTANILHGRIAHCLAVE